MPRRPHRLTSLFLAVVVPAAAALVWLGIRLLQQDRALYASRAIEQQDAAADAIVRALSARLAAVQRDLAASPIAAGLPAIVEVADAVTLMPASAFAWHPAADALREAESALFADADLLEARGEPERALAISRRYSRSADRAVRAGALLRVARVSVKTGEIDEALRACGELATEPQIAFDGMPADLVARRRRLELRRQHRPSMDVTPEVEALIRDFAGGRWQLPQDAWEHVAATLVSELGARTPDWSSRRTLSSAVDMLLEPGPRDARRSLVVEGTVVTALTRASERSRVTALVAPATIDTWLEAARKDLPSGVPVALHDEADRFISGAPDLRDQRLVRRTAADTGLPWAVVVGSVPVATQELRRRELLMVLGLGSLVLLVVGGSAVLWRGLQRELAVARLQGDFVAAVSHEFRTPLTSLRHAIELLQEDDEMRQDHRRSFYDVLARNTERLNRLVESLLDFGRMEEGRRPYRLEPVDPAELARRVADEFTRDAAARAHTVDVQIAPAVPAHVFADRDALGHALWNLLDNAVKYSPGGSQIELHVRPHAGALAIEVIDNGLGIPSHEREEIFEKFVRGEQARTHGIRGTGVGLAIVSHVVRAHGGTIQVDSEEGKGSTFRLLLPVTSSS